MMLGPAYTVSHVLLAAREEASSRQERFWRSHCCPAHGQNNQAPIPLRRMRGIVPSTGDLRRWGALLLQGGGVHSGPY